MAEPHSVSLGWWGPALLVDCPFCQSKRGEICRTGRGGALWGRPHRTRRRRALDLPPGQGPTRHYRADPLRTYRARQAAGWTTNTLGWVAPCGTSEDDWATEGHPFPEEPGFAEWHQAFYHHEALDSDLAPNELNPYPLSP